MLIEQQKSQMPLLYLLLGAGITGIILLSYWLVGYYYSKVIIGLDEANFVLISSQAILDAQSWPEFVDSLFQTHGQHVLVGMQLANMLTLAITGSLNFQVINFLGITYLLIIAICLIRKKSPSWQENLLYAAIVVPVVFAQNHNTCAINTACSGNHYLGLSLAVTALYFFSRNNSFKDFITAEILLILAVFSSPAALVLVPLVYPVLYWMQSPLKLYGSLHTALMLLTLLIYFCVTQPISIEGDAPVNALHYSVMMIIFFFNLLGNALLWPTTTGSGIVSVAIGITICCWGILLLRKFFSTKKTPKSIFYASGFVMMLLIVSLLAFGRAYSIGSPRYAIYANLTLLFLLLLWLELQTGAIRQKLYALIFLALCFYPIQFISHAAYLEHIARDIANCETRWQTEQQACGFQISHQHATQLLLNAESRQLLRLNRDGLKP